MKIYMKSNSDNASTEISNTSKLVMTTRVQLKKANNIETGIIDTVLISLSKSIMKKSMVSNMESTAKYL